MFKQLNLIALTTDTYPTAHYYDGIDAGDNLDTILTANYFLDIARLKVGSLIIIVATDGIKLAQVISLNPTTLIPFDNNGEQINADWNATSGLSQILNKPANVSIATPNTLLYRDVNGRAQMADPSTAQDIATKNYVDTHITVGNNQIAFGTSGGGLQSNANYTVNGTGGLTIAQILTAAGGSFSASVSGFNITGTSPSCNVGSTTNYATSSAIANFFNGTAINDTCIRNINTSNAMHIGIGSGNAQWIIRNTQITANVGIACAGTISGSNGNFASGTVNASLVTGQLQSGAIGANRMSYTDSSNNVIGSTNYTVNGSGGLTITQTLTCGGMLLPTTGGTAATLDYYEQNGTFNANMSTPAAGFSSLTFTVTRVGKLISISWTTLSVTATVLAKFLASGGTVPIKWRPVNNIQFSVNVTNNSSNVGGTFKINTDGSLEIGISAASNEFTASGTASFLASSVSYYTS